MNIVNTSFRKGDRIMLPPTLSQPGGEYRIVTIDDTGVRLISTKGITRSENINDLPTLMARALPAATKPIASNMFNRDVGVLSAEGYHVGATANLPVNKRQIVLRRVFHKPAPDLWVGGDEVYRAEWGEAGTDTRLAKMMRCLENFIMTHLRSGQQYRRSIDEWKADLDWLVKEFRVPNGF